MRLIIYFIIIFISSVIIAGTSTMIVNKGLTRSGVDFYGKMNAARTAPEPQVLMVGSSRVLAQLDPVIIDSVTSMVSYNYGLNAAGIKTCYNLITYALKYEQNVKVILLNIDYNMFGEDNDPYKAAYYYPYENSVNGMQIHDQLNNDLIHRLKVFDISLYDDYAKYAAINGWLRPGRNARGGGKGYYPHVSLHDFKDPGKEVLVKHNIQFSEEGMNELKRIINVCQQKDIKLLLCLAPYYRKYFPALYINNYYRIINRVKEVADIYHIPLLDFTSLAISDDRSNFYNVNHMNVKGATLYSLYVANVLKEQVGKK